MSEGQKSERYLVVGEEQPDRSKCEMENSAYIGDETGQTRIEGFTVSNGDIIYQVMAVLQKRKV